MDSIDTLIDLLWLMQIFFVSVSLFVAFIFLRVIYRILKAILKRLEERLED